MCFMWTLWQNRDFEDEMRSAADDAVMPGTMALSPEKPLSLSMSESSTCYERSDALIAGKPGSINGTCHEKSFTCTKFCKATGILSCGYLGSVGNQHQDVYPGGWPIDSRFSTLQGWMAGWLQVTWGWPLRPTSSHRQPRESSESHCHA